jgi:hypothetical protein
MKADLLIKKEGSRALLNNLELDEAERFITLIRRDHFDYTEWRKNLWPDISVRDLSKRASEKNA